jgi:unsaturated chondroitin disaccharide hydrolase
MKKTIMHGGFFLFILSIVISTCSHTIKTPHHENLSTVPVKMCMTFAERQLAGTVEAVRDSLKFPRFTRADGSWETTDSASWSSGFFPGCLWLMYEYTGDNTWKKHAVRWTNGMEKEKFCTTNHNNGFKMLPSFGNGFRLTGDNRYRDVLIESARSLALRFNPKVGQIRFSDDKPWKYPVIIDTMVNIELLFRASQHGGDPKWFDMAVTHALTTMRDHIRGDGSTIQLIDYDPGTGGVIAHGTLCGLSGESAWSRGQGEALYGFTAAYRYTKKPEFLAAACRVADYFIKNLPEDFVPYWDFKDPAIPAAIRDSSAASIAAAGLLELKTFVADEKLRNTYHHAAVRILESLASSRYLAQGSGGYGILKHGTWKKPTDPHADTSLIWGDYYFLEALMRFHKGT